MEIHKLIDPPMSRVVVGVGIVGAVLMNGLFFLLNRVLMLPVFLDSNFTIIATVLFGLWPGLTVGVLSNLFFEVIAGFPGFLYPFALVNMLTAVIVHLFVRNGHFKSLLDALVVLIAVALANALAGTVIVTVFMGGTTGEPVDSLVRALVVAGQSIGSSAFIARVLINVVDKVLGVGVGFFCYHILQRSMERKIRES